MIKSITTAALIFVCMAYASQDSQANEWILYKNKAGIACFSMLIEGSEYKQFKGETIIDAPYEVVFEVLEDIPAYTQWMFSCIKNEILKSKGEIGHKSYRIYYVNHSTWPVADRDAIIETNTQTDCDNARSTVFIKSVNDPTRPVPAGRVRMKWLKTTFYVNAIDRTHTRVVFEIANDPGENLSAFLFNDFMKDHPYETLKNLKRMATLELYKNRGQTSWFKGCAERQAKLIEKK